ncbi:25624_t:CDS:2 [Dentiscutata erythropus]|uniref:25624_t:CDS:1 n=1 Tax=Dentiscutata erythropus TaxID=1348616 RepID=A0A9N8Z752_9GLOM|nr:25624_t:CDS:2 [Dentiscutata erythropus]
MIVVMSTHLTIFDRASDSNKCPLKVSLIETPQEKLSPIGNTNNSIIEMLITDYINNEFLDYEYFEYQDPDFDYEILDDNESYLENTSEIPSSPKTTTDESVTTDNEYANGFTFDERALSHAKNFAASSIEDLEQDEKDINWLTLDNNLQSEVESMWTLPTDNSNIIDYEIGGEINTNNLSKSNEQCVIIDYAEGRFQRCLNLVSRPLKQLIGIWELDFQILDVAVKNKTINALNNLGPQKLGEALETVVWKSKSEVRAQRETLEAPNTLQEFHNAFPKSMKQLFNNFVIFILQKKWEIVQKKYIQRRMILAEFNTTRAIKILTFIMSLIFSIAFPGINIWLLHIMSSLCRKPRQLNSLYAILCTANVVSHTNRYERKLEKQRSSNIDISKKLLYGEDIWNLCIIDNIDFKESTFVYDNIFDVPKRIAHATLRTVFQFKLPQSLSSIAKQYNLIFEYEF